MEELMYIATKAKKARFAEISITKLDISFAEED